MGAREFAKTAVRAAAAIVPAAFLFGCATRIPVTVTKPAEVNMSAMRKVAVLDFEVVPGTRRYRTEDTIRRLIEGIFRFDAMERTLEERVARYATERVILALVDTGYFQVVSPSEVREVLRGKPGRGAGIPQVGEATGAQAVISGGIYLLESRDEESVTTVDVRDAETGAVTREIRYWVTRTASLGLDYAVINARTGAIVAEKSFEKTLEEKMERGDLNRLPRAEDMYEKIIDSFMPSIARQLAPYKVRESRRLMKERSSRMERAARLAKNGLYEEALAVYLEVWGESGKPEAGFNGAILHEVTGNLDAAIDLMKKVASVSGERRAAREYRRLLRVREERKRLEEQLAGER